MSTGLFEVMQMGGPIMWALFIGSVLALGVFFERVILFHRCTVNMDRFLKGIANLIRSSRYDEALERCDEAYGPAVRVVQSAIIKRDLPKAELRELTQEVAQLQMPKLEANLPLLSTIGYVSPLLGLLGTVMGMISAFQQLNKSLGAAPISDLAGGIWEALVTTGMGLGVAIPCYVAYNYLVSRLNRLVTDMERSGIEILQILGETKESSKVVAEAPAAPRKEATKLEAPSAQKEIPKEKSSSPSGATPSSPATKTQAIPVTGTSIKASEPSVAGMLKEEAKVQAVPENKPATPSKQDEVKKSSQSLTGFWSRKKS